VPSATRERVPRPQPQALFCFGPQKTPPQGTRSPTDISERLGNARSMTAGFRALVVCAVQGFKVFPRKRLVKVALSITRKVREVGLPFGIIAIDALSPQPVHSALPPQSRDLRGDGVLRG
jgi:hypothetical protein